MYLMHGVRQRVLLLITALALVAAATFALGAHLSWWPKPLPRPGEHLLPSPSFIDDPAQTAAIVTIVVGGLLIVLALWWAASLLPQRVRDAHLRWSEGGSVTTLDARELGRQLAESLTRRPGISHADVAIHGTAATPRLIVQVTAEATTDLEAVRDAVIDAVVRPAEAMLGRPFHQVDVEYHANSQPAASSRADLDLNRAAERAVAVGSR